MAVRIRPKNDRNPMRGYAPAFDIAVFFPSVCKGVVHGLRPENLPPWLTTYCQHEGLESETLFGAMLDYIRAVKRVQTDADCPTLEQALDEVGFNARPTAVRLVVLGRVAEFTGTMFAVAIKDAQVLENGGAPVRYDVQLALDAAQTEIDRGQAGRFRRAWACLVGR